MNVGARARLTPVEAVDDAQRLTRHELRGPQRNSSVDEDPAGVLVGAKNVSLDVQEVARLRLQIELLDGRGQRRAARDLVLDALDADRDRIPSPE